MLLLGLLLCLCTELWGGPGHELLNGVVSSPFLRPSRAYYINLAARLNEEEITAKRRGIYLSFATTKYQALMRYYERSGDTQNWLNLATKCAAHLRDTLDHQALFSLSSKIAKHATNNETQRQAFVWAIEAFQGVQAHQPSKKPKLHWVKKFEELCTDDIRNSPPTGWERYVLDGFYKSNNIPYPPSFAPDKNKDHDLYQRFTEHRERNEFPEAFSCASEIILTSSNNAQRIDVFSALIDLTCNNEALYPAFAACDAYARRFIAIPLGKKLKKKLEKLYKKEVLVFPWWRTQP